MPITDVQINEGSKGLITTFATALRPVWELAVSWELHKVKGKNQGPVGNGNIQLVEKDGKIIDTIESDLDQIVALGTKWAESRGQGGAGDYRIAILGYATKPNPRRRSPPDIIELNGLTIKLGEPSEGAPAEGPDISFSRAAAELLKAGASTIADHNTSSANQAAGYEKLLEVQQRTILAQGAQIATSSDTDIRALTLQVQLGAQGIDFEKWKFEQEEKRLLAQMQHEVDIQRIQSNSQLGNRALGLITQIVQLKMAQMGMSPPADESEPDDIPGQLRALLKSLTDEEKVQVIEMITDRMWDLLVSASRATSDADATAILSATKREVKANPKIAMGLYAAKEVLGEERSARLMALLVRAGVLPKT